MLAPRWLPLILLAFIPVSSVRAADWKHLNDKDRHETNADVAYVSRTLQRTSDKRQVTLQLVFFTSPKYEIKVIDQGVGPLPRYPSTSAAATQNGCLAATNGGFFHPGFRPAGLMISEGKRIHRFEKANLLAGVLYCDADGIYLIRRSAFKDHPNITALIQSGPYLVENGKSTRGLSKSQERRRTFICTDWRGNWALGVSSQISLATLGEILSDKDAIQEWQVNRALNLDGGSSSALYYDREGQPDVSIPNWKRVRNLIGIAPR